MLIPSFQVDHTKIVPGIYVSRTDSIGGDYATTFDVRMKTPNKEPAIHPNATKVCPVEDLRLHWKPDAADRPQAGRARCAGFARDSRLLPQDGREDGDVVGA